MEKKRRGGGKSMSSSKRQGAKALGGRVKARMNSRQGKWPKAKGL